MKNLSIITLSLLLSSCDKLFEQAKHDDHQGGAPPPAVVSVAPPTQKTIAEWDEFIGRTDAIESVDIKPRVSGYIAEINFKAGQVVKKDDVLFVIDPRPYEAEFNRAVATVEQAQGKLNTAEREAKRADELVKSKAISVEEAETRRSALTSTRAGLRVAEASRDIALIDLEHTKVRSPINGRISRAFLTVGNYATGVPGANTMLATVVSADPVYAYVSVDEARYLKYQRLFLEKKMVNPNDAKVMAEVKLDGEEGFPHKGFIESFDNRMDAATGSIAMRCIVPNPDGLIAPGSFIRLRIPGSEEHPVLLVDDKIIGTDQSEKFVLTVGADNVAVYKNVKLGPLIDGLRVIRSGLTAKDRVITTNLQMVRPGAPVNPM